MYADLINRAINAVHQKGVATKILQGMDRIRNEFDEVQARRWPTELLQNARDLSTPDRPVRVRIELTDEHIYRALYDFVACQPLLPVQGGFHALSDPAVRLVQAETREQRENWRSSAVRSGAGSCRKGRRIGARSFPPIFFRRKSISRSVLSWSGPQAR